MKVLVAGDFAFAHLERDFCEGLRLAGAEVIELPVLRFFGPGSLLRRAQTKLVRGPGVALANAALVAACARHKPDLVLAWRTPWLSPLAIHLARAAGAGRVVLFNNDDPFGPDRELRIWRSFRLSIPHADACFAYRAVNLDELRAAGARRVGLLRSPFNPRRHHPLELSLFERARFGSEVVFVGHCEDDGRIESLEALAAAGLDLRLFGSGWEKHLRGRPLERLLPIKTVFDDDYLRALCGAKIALVFLSRRNRDQSTQRCFEIPAVGTLMLAPRTGELGSLFREGEEAEFFSSNEELVAKALRYVSDDAARSRLARAGQERVWRDGHDAASRARRFLVEALE